jgi:hypothetical protein
MSSETTGTQAENSVSRPNPDLKIFDKLVGS